MTINRDAFARLADWFEQHPDAHNQGVWGRTGRHLTQAANISQDQSLSPIDRLEVLVTECGSSFCLAGTAVVQAGYLPVLGRNSEGEVVSVDYGTVQMPNGCAVGTPDVAADLLFKDPESPMKWMFAAEAEPAEGYDVGSAMRAIADGADPRTVWIIDRCPECDDPRGDCDCD